MSCNSVVTYSDTNTGTVTGTNTESDSNSNSQCNQQITPTCSILGCKFLFFSCGHCTTNLSAMGSNSLPVSDRPYIWMYVLYMYMYICMYMCMYMWTTRNRGGLYCRIEEGGGKIKGKERGESVGVVRGAWIEGTKEDIYYPISVARDKLGLGAPRWPEAAKSGSLHSLFSRINETSKNK